MVEHGRHASDAALVGRVLRSSWSVVFFGSALVMSAAATFLAWRNGTARGEKSGSAEGA